MNENFQDYNGKFLVIYLDDILIFSCSLEEHLKHLSMVFKRLQENKLIINLEKCTFLQKELTFLGFVISQGTLKMDPSKVEAIVNWPPPKTQSDVKSFSWVSHILHEVCEEF